VDGVSLKSLWRNPRQAALARTAGGLIFHRPDRDVSVIRQGEYKLLLNWDKDGVVASRELYRFAPDPRETDRNIASKEPERVRQLEAALLAYLKSSGAETKRSCGSLPSSRACWDCRSRWIFNRGSHSFLSMNRLCSAFLLLFAALALVTITARAERPNVLFIIANDLNHWVGHLGRNPQA
jgi:hypothetical protein